MKYDLVVFGGGTAGVACAYTAAKSGIKTLLVEKSDVLGGSMTQGLVIPCMNTDDNDINNSFYSDLIHFADKYNARITYTDGNKGWFNPELLKIVFDDMLSAVKCDVLFSTETISIDNKSPNNFKILLFFKMLSLCIEASYLVDATGFGKIFKILNYKFQNKNIISQSPTLRFNISNVDLKKFEKFITEIDKDADVTSSCKVNGETHLSTAYTSDKSRNWSLAPLFEMAVAAKDIENEDCVYFQLFTIPAMPGTVALNCPQITLNGDLNDVFVYSEALKQGRKRVLRLFNFCKKYLKGFENTFISHISDTLGVREDYRIKGKYTFCHDDMLKGKEFAHIAFSGDYPVDIHSSGNECEMPKQRKRYYVPVEALISEENENVFGIGRCLSADFKAQSALRIQRHCFSMGEAVSKYIYEQINQSK